MATYQAYPKQAIKRAMRRRELAGSVPSLFNVSKWPQWWETGAKELEKTTPGKIITAPIRLPEAVITATKKTVEQVPGVVKSASNALPIIAVGCVLLGAGYLIYTMKKKSL
jgi:hypothetical protein